MHRWVFTEICILDGGKGVVQDTDIVYIIDSITSALFITPMCVYRDAYTWSNYSRGITRFYRRQSINQLIIGSYLIRRLNYVCKYLVTPYPDRV